MLVAENGGDVGIPRGHKYAKNDPRASEDFPGSSYTADEAEWLKAINRAQCRLGKRNLDCREVLAVLKSLGYSKDDTR